MEIPTGGRRARSGRLRRTPRWRWSERVDSTGSARPHHRGWLPAVVAHSVDPPEGGSVDLEATGGAVLGPVGAVVGEVRRATLEHRRLEPQPLEVPDVAAGAVVLVGRTAVEHVVVVDELHVAG